MATRDALVLDKLSPALRDYFNFETRVGWSLSYFEDTNFFTTGTEAEQLEKLRSWENALVNGRDRSEGPGLRRV